MRRRAFTILRLPLALLLTAAVWLASVGVTAIRLETPATGPLDAREWFPCIDHGCGCQSAEMCRTACCCRPVALPAARAQKAPPAATASSTCCASSGGSTPAPADRGESTLKPVRAERAHGSAPIILRSARCSGRQLLLSFGVLHWLAPGNTLDTWLRPTSRSVLPAPAALTSLSLALDPPPPRLA
jgi:hypothetical protein